MKRFLLVLLVILMIATPAFARMIIGSGGGAPPPSYPDILFWVNFDGNWSSPTYTIGATEYSIGDTTGTATGAVIAAEAKKNGTYGLDAHAASHYLDFAIAGGGDTYGDILWTSEGRLGFWIYWTTYDGTGYRSMFNAGGSGGIALSSYGTEVYVDSLTRTGTSTGASLASGSWFFIEWSWDTVLDKQYLYVNGSSALLTISTAIAPVDWSAGKIMRIGNSSSTGTQDFWIGQVMISNDASRDLYALKDILAYPGP